MRVDELHANETRVQTLYCPFSGKACDEQSCRFGHPQISDEELEEHQARFGDKVVYVENKLYCEILDAVRLAKSWFSKHGASLGYVNPPATDDEAEKIEKETKTAGFMSSRNLR